MSTNRDQTSTNGKSKAFLTTFVWAPGSENAFSAVILASKDVFETFWGAHNGVYGAIFGGMGGWFGVILAFFEQCWDFLWQQTPTDPNRPQQT